MKAHDDPTVRTLARAERWALVAALDAYGELAAVPFADAIGLLSARERVRQTRAVLADAMRAMDARVTA